MFFSTELQSRSSDLNDFISELLIINYLWVIMKTTGELFRLLILKTVIRQQFSVTFCRLKTLPDYF